MNPIAENARWRRRAIRARQRRNPYEVVRKMIQNQKEIHVHDHEFDGSACTQIAAGVDATHLTDIAQGDGDGERIGDAIRLKSISVKGFAQQTGAQISSVRLIIFRDMNQTGADEPTTTDVLAATTNISSGIDKSEQSSKRFIILLDEQLECNSTGKGSYSFIKFYKRFKQPLKINYVGVDATTASAGSGSLWMFYLTDVGANHPTLGMNVQMRYYD